MKQVNRRFWSLLLCVALALAVLPTVTFMADPMADPLLEGWTKIEGGYTGDLGTSVINPYDVVVNDKQIVQNPNIYTLTNGFSTFQVMKGTYSAGQYTFSPISASQPFRADSIPVSLAFVGSAVSPDIYTLYVATNNMYISPFREKIWKFDGTTWTDITYGLGINAPSLAAYGNNLFAVGTTGVRTLYFLWEGATAWESVNLASHITADLVAVAPVSKLWGQFLVLDKTGKIWKVTVNRDHTPPPQTNFDSCIQVTTTPSGGGSDLIVTENNVYVTDAAAKCLQVFQSSTGSWVVMKNGASNAFNAPMGVALDAQEQIYLSEPNGNSSAFYRQHAFPRLAWTTQPGSGVTGGSLSTQPVLKLMYSDMYGDQVAAGNSANKVKVTLTPETGTLSGTNEVTLVNGVATFAGLGVTGPGTYTLTASCGGLGSVSSSFTIAAATYGIDLDKSGTQTFAGQAENYSAVSPLTVGVSNAGNQPTGALTVALSGANAGSFALSKTDIGSIAVSGSDSFTVGPNTGLAAGTYTATVTVSGGSVTSKSFDVSFTVAAATYGIDLDKSGTQTFAGQIENYSAVSPLTVGIDNTGNQPTGALTVALSGANAGSFTLSETGIDSIAVSGDSSFTVGPNTGLTAGTYTATVTVSGGSVTSKSFDVSFTVTAATYGIDLDKSGMQTFAGQIENYSAVTPLTVGIDNTGNQPTGALTVALSGTNAGSFALSETDIGSIAVSGDDSFTVGPNTGLAAGTYTATVTVSGGSVTSKSFDVSFTVAAATYGIDLDKSGTQTFAGQIVGYSAVSPLTVGIDNIGNQPTGALTIALSGSNADSFALSKTAIDSIAVSGSDSFTVGPNIDLAVGTYTATVTVSGGSVTSKSFDVSFTVNPVPTYGIDLDKSGTQTFTGQAEGYSAVSPLTVGIDNIGNQPTGALTVALSGTNAASFGLSKAAIDSIAVSGSDSFTVGPNADLTAGTYTATVTVSGGSVTTKSFDVSFTVAAATYGIDLDKSGTQTFTGQTVGYSAVAPLTVGIDNIGNQPTGALTVALSGSNASSFALSKAAIDSIAVSGDDSFTVGPNTGLLAGTYTATVTVSGGSVTSQTFDVSFTVDPVPTHTVTASAGAGGAISPSGTVSVTEGDDAAFTITPDAGYSVSSVVVDSVDQGAVSSYTFFNARGDHTIQVTFAYTGGGSSDPYMPRTLIHDPTGVTASGNSVHVLAQLIVSPLDLHANCAACDVIRQAQSDGQVSLGYNITLTQNFIGALTVSVPVDSRYNGRTITILHCANGRLESLNAAVANGVATFTVSELSPFAVTGLTYSPKTGDAAEPAGFIALGLAALCAGWLIARRRRRA